jgi:hypothetical protein
MRVDRCDTGLHVETQPPFEGAEHCIHPDRMTCLIKDRSAGRGNFNLGDRLRPLGNPLPPGAMHEIGLRRLAEKDAAAFRRRRQRCQAEAQACSGRSLALETASAVGVHPVSLLSRMQKPSPYPRDRQDLIPAAPVIELHHG